ncbi:MAG: VOC family protein [Saprospiraceae bacterium]
MSYSICGIQQIGLGNDHVYKTWEYYRKYLGMDLPIFDEAAEAGLMLPYTGGQPRKRHAVLALNYQGGGGVEIWQYTERKASYPKEKISIGDLGIFSVKYKAEDVEAVYHKFKSEGLNILTDVHSNPFGEKHFFCADILRNVFEIVDCSDDWYAQGISDTGGVYGCTIGVSDMDTSLIFYRDILGYDQIEGDQTAIFDDFAPLGGTENTYRRVLLTHSESRVGPFSRLLGKSYIELVQNMTTPPKKIFEDRFWGDMGYIHLCFDVLGMDQLKNKCTVLDYPFTVDSASSFDMGEAAGRFCYTEDPDGTLIEFVETHKIPIMKKWNWYLDLTKRSRVKPLARWMLKALSWNRVKGEVF